MTDAPILLDFESVSRADLKKIGGRLYWEHPSSRPLCCAWYDTADGSIGVWQPGDEWPHRSRTLAAHNWRGFDAFAAIRLGWCTAEEARQYVDTSELARRAGLPGALDALGTRWCGFPKDKEASRFTKSLSSVRRPSGAKNPNAISADVWRDLSDDEKRERGVQPEITPEAMQRVITYCLSDVEIMAHGWPMLESWRNIEPDVERVDRIVNDRGVYFDRELARALLECDAANTERVIAEVAEEMWATPEEVRAQASSPSQFAALTGAANAQKATVATIDHPLARARQALASIARGKLEAGLARTSADGRMRDTLRYYGASTGRWSGRGMQLQNMPKPAKRFEKLFEEREFDDEQIDAWICDLADRVIARTHVADQEEIDLLVRATICGAPGKGLAVCDFSGVEARANAWYAGDTQAVDVFLSGRDAYKVAASAVFGVPYEKVTKAQRQLGKVLELACGYGQGGKKFAETAAKMGADLNAVGINSFAAVKAWRRLHAPIVQFWQDCEDAFVRAIRGETTRVADFTFTPSDDGRDVAIFLPSGRPIVYCDTRISERVIYNDDGSERRTQSICMPGLRGDEWLYGGLIVENVIQAACRDLMADAMVRAEDAGLPVVMTVHDEIVAEVDRAAMRDAFDELRRIMTTWPEWAAGFPGDAAGFSGLRYRK
jgi:DNA polymerase